MDKKTLRSIARAARDKLPEADRRRKSLCIARRAAELAADGATAFVYASVGTEADTAPLIGMLREKGCRICLPRIVAKGNMEAAEARADDALPPDRFGIPAPREGQTVPPEAIDIVFAPGLAFDRSGGRLGYGGGYYDRFLQKTRCPCWGLAFSGQLVERVPTERTDIRMDGVITESETICTKSE